VDHVPGHAQSAHHVRARDVSCGPSPEALGPWGLGAFFQRNGSPPPPQPYRPGSPADPAPRRSYLRHKTATWRRAVCTWTTIERKHILARLFARRALAVTPSTVRTALVAAVLLICAAAAHAAPAFPVKYRADNATSWTRTAPHSRSWAGPPGSSRRYRSPTTGCSSMTRSRAGSTRSSSPFSTTIPAATMYRSTATATSRF